MARVAEAVAALPAGAAPVLAVQKAAVAAVEGQDQATQAAGTVQLDKYLVATGRTRHQRKVTNARCNGGAPKAPITHGTYSQYAWVKI